MVLGNQTVDSLEQDTFWLDIFIPILCVIILAIALVVLDRCNLEVSPEVTEQIINIVCFCSKDKNTRGVYVDLEDSEPSTSENTKLSLYDTNEATTRPHSDHADVQAITQTNQTKPVGECSHSHNAPRDASSSTGDTEEAYTRSQFANDEQKINKEPTTTNSDSDEPYCRQSVSLLVTAIDVASTKLKQRTESNNPSKNQNKSTKNTSAAQMLHSAG